MLTKGDQLHPLRKQRGYNRQDPKEAPRTRLASMDDVMDNSGTLTGKQGRAPEDVAGNSGETLGNQAKRRRVGDPLSAFVAEQEVAKEHAQWRNRDLKSRLNASAASVVGGVDAAISAWVAGE